MALCVRLRVILCVRLRVALCQALYQAVCDAVCQAAYHSLCQAACHSVCQALCQALCQAAYGAVCYAAYHFVCQAACGLVCHAVCHVVCQAACVTVCEVVLRGPDTEVSQYVTRCFFCRPAEFRLAREAAVAFNLPTSVLQQQVSACHLSRLLDLRPSYLPSASFAGSCPPLPSLFPILCFLRLFFSFALLIPFIHLLS